MNINLRLVFWQLSFSIILLSNIFAQKTDIVRLTNGDVLTGEVKYMEFAQIKFSTSAMSTIYIEWDSVAYIHSDKSFKIEDQLGNNWFGTLSTDTTINKLVMSIDTSSYYININNVVRIFPIQQTFWNKLKLSVDLGFNYTKASDVGTLSFSGSGSYRTISYLRELKFNSISTAKKDSTTAENHNVDFTFTRYWENYLFLSTFTGVQKNTELGLDLRVYLGSQFGKDLIRSNTILWNTALGLQAAREFQNDDEKSTDLEGVVSTKFKKFQYHSPKIDFTTDIMIYPSITTWGRVRYTFDTKLKWEIFNDLFWQLTIYDYFDNQPSTNMGTHDYGIIISFGWSKT